METTRRSLFCIQLLVLVSSVSGWWLMTQMSSSQFPSNYCNAIPGLSRRQRSICFQNIPATRALHKGLREAIGECRVQFAHEKWNCSSSGAYGAAPLKVGSKESAYVYAIVAGGSAMHIAKECAKGTIPDCGCGERPRKTRGVDNNNFTWAGCSDNVKYGNAFSRKFIDATEKTHMDARSKMNLHNNRVGRKVLAANQRRQCKCHGVSGSCVTRTCWSVVPSVEEFASVLKKKYQKAQQVTVVPDNSELMVRPTPTNIRNERYVKVAPTPTYRPPTLPANRGDLVYLEESPDYCVVNEQNEVEGTSGRECFSTNECSKLCCGRGWHIQREFRQEPCRCKFIWCCDVKCDTCIKEVERYFCR
ncbi:wnt family domain-containing protein [Ditylenchus destructor]|nr:wnt family domain-containing protein [Ditylenchus destructor]